MTPDGEQNFAALLITNLARTYRWQTAKRCGYTVMSEKTVPEYRLDLSKGYTPQGFAEKVFHLHIRQPGDWDEIVFRDFFRQNPAKA